MTVLHIASFAGGVNRQGSSDAQRADELRRADSYDIGDRGQLVPAGERAVFASSTVPNILGMLALGTPQNPQVVVAGDSGGGGVYIAGTIDPSTGAVATALLGLAYEGGTLATFASFPFVDSSGAQIRLVLVNFGARSFLNPRDAYGLIAMKFSGGAYALYPIQDFDALGTGPSGQVTGGTNGKRLYFRGITAYNNHAWGWGFDDADSSKGDGPARLMFSNAGNPLKWGYDETPDDVTTDRAFVDSDAFSVGDSGEVIRAGYAWQGKLWIATNKELHWIAGYGRESFLTNGAVGLRKSLNVLGPHCLIEGPDGFFYGVSDYGLWRCDGSSVEHLYRRLVSFDGRSSGYWDLIWNAAGTTNGDRVWMLADPETMQVWVVIPSCNATAGYGAGSDTVIIKYHCQTGGFTRQVIPGVILAHGCVFPREGGATPKRFVGATGTGANDIQTYGARSGGASAAMPTALPVAELGEYAPFGPNGVGVLRKTHLTFSWEAASALPLKFTLTPTIDGQSGTAVHLTIGPTQPVGPSNGDLWVDTSGTDTNLGNGTAGTFLDANAADYLIKRYVTTWAKWTNVPGGGQQGTRITVPVAFTPRRGARVTLLLECTAASGRYQVEGSGLTPQPIREDA